MESRDAFMAANMGVIIAMAAILSIFAIFMIISQWIIYTKAKQPGWACIIPIYNLIVLLKIVGRPVSWIFWFLQIFVFAILLGIAPNAITVLLYFLSIITAFVFAIIITNSLSKSFGKDAGFTVGLIFLGFIFYPILAFGSAKYIGPGGISDSDTDPLV